MATSEQKASELVDRFLSPVTKAIWSSTRIEGSLLNVTYSQKLAALKERKVACFELKLEPNCFSLYDVIGTYKENKPG